MPAKPERFPAEKVYLVGAGPGEPGLITARGLECLSRADVVLYDCLVNPALLRSAPEGAQFVAVDPPVAERGASGGSRALSLLEQAAKKGGVVVYLKGGDPEVFSRAGPELDLLRREGVAFEVVPGVTAALAAAAYAGISFTHARYSSAVALVTGRQSRGQPAAGLDYAALARFPGTLVFYMALESVGEWVPALLGAGMSGQTPTAVVQRVSWPDQQTTRCTLGELADVVARGQVHEPSVIVIGEVVRLAEPASWFTARPLFGRRVLLTRPQAQSQAMADRLRELGAEVLFQPAIRISSPTDWGPVDRVIDRIAEFDWVVFSSVNGVQYFLGRLWERHQDVRALGRARLAAIGPATAEALKDWRVRAELVPREYRAEELAEALVQWARDEGGAVGCAGGQAEESATGAESALASAISGHGGHGPQSLSSQREQGGVAPEQTGPLAGRRILLLRASRGREVLAERLTQAGARVEQVVVYTSVDVEQPCAQVAEALAAGRIDWVTVTSSAIARSLTAMLGENLRRARLASISPVTSGVLRKLGFAPAVEAQTYTMEGLVEAILAWECDV